MSSLLSGFGYDIFISYRQKDNKYDGWVTEFVDHLKAELESTFKEAVSVYIDINPHDGLLETHDVDASLKDKLKCLIFIPILSRTYCDPKSFAWEHELKAFVELASQDQFGMKVKLPSGNVAGRVLPVRIHDLDAGDIEVCESVLGGYLRGVEFIYKSHGVNRPLRAKEENPHDNLNHTNYRDQINKVALVIREIIESMKISVTHEEKEEEKETRKKEVPWKKEIKIKDSDQEVKATRPERGRRLPLLKRSRRLIPTLIFIVILGIGIGLLSHRARKKWAKEEAITEIEQLVNLGNIADAYNLVQKANKYVSTEPKFLELSSLVSSELTILTDPPGAEVYIREYSALDEKWKKLGRTPVDSIKIPGGHSYWATSSIYLMRIEKPGYESVLAAISTTENIIERKLFRQGSIPHGMVYLDTNRCFIDRYEVTNKQYKAFVDKGGYSNPDYWKSEFKKDGKVISRDEAMTLLVDKSGRPGPSTWEAGDYPDGQDDYPVSGVSWYEAAAYAEYAGKSLPASEHWRNAKGSSFLYNSKLILLSNFKGKGPDPVGKNQGVSSYGVYDMAGNVREWCMNETPVGHIIRGGAWNDATYLAYELSHVPSFDRSPKNGFRCVQYIDKVGKPESAFQMITFSNYEDYSAKKPVPEDIFRVYKNRFLYDSTDLRAVIEKKFESHEDWTIEKISFNAAYGTERVIAFLFLPRNVSPPYQTILFFPGLGARWESDLIKSNETKWLTDYLIKSGRAVMCPVYKGTFDRIDVQEPVVLQGRQTWDWVTRWVKDFKRSVDYLETRPDIDIAKLGYYGSSLGGLMGGIIPALEDRLKVNILLVGGLRGEEMVDFLPRVKIPTLMLNGRYDFTFPLENAVQPFYKFLGTPAGDKRLIVYETDHYVPRNEMIREVLAWCDKYLGPVSPARSSKPAI